MKFCCFSELPDQFAVLHQVKVSPRSPQCGGSFRAHFVIRISQTVSCFCPEGIVKVHINTILTNVTFVDVKCNIASI